LSDSLEARLQPVNDLSNAAGTKMVHEGMSAYNYAPANKQKLTSSTEVVQVIKKHMGGKTPDPKANGNTVL
jgi:hypothetical protein